MDATFKIPPQLPPKMKKKSPLFNLAAEEQSESCDAAVAALGVGSLLEVPSATAAVATSFQMQ